MNTALSDKKLCF